MRYLHTIFVFLCFTLLAFFSFWIQETFANGLITQVNENSSEIKVRKLQEVFKWLGLYNWEIDWNFNSIKEALVNYQVENGIVPNKDHYEAGYFWNKTINSLKQKFWKNFEDLQKEFLTLETPKEWQEWYFVVTAYYSPVAWQSKYTTWSYETELRLNGWWNTANWKKPSNWTIAAPRNYPFWTKIYLEWFWVWEVNDRWWAIVNSWDNWHLHDRIDIWMWYWDEGRIRTAAWWVKTVKGSIVSSNTQIKTNFETFQSPEDSTSNSNKPSQIDKYKNLYVSAENPNSDDVLNLQKLLKEVNLYNWNLDWKYDSIKDILINFQLENKIIFDKNSPEAGYFWKKTFEAFKNKFWNNFELVNNSPTPVVQNTLESKETLSSELTQAEKERLKLVRDEIYNEMKNKVWWNEQALQEYLLKSKDTLRNYSKKYSWKKLEILNYFIEIL